MALGARKDRDERAREYLKPPPESAVPPKATPLTAAAVRSVRLLLPEPRKTALRAVIREFVEDVVAPILRVLDVWDAYRLLDESAERAHAALRFIWSVLGEYDARALDQIVREQFDKYMEVGRTGTRSSRPPRIRKDARTAHDDAFALMEAARSRLWALRARPVPLPESVDYRLTRATVDVEVLSFAVMMAMTRDRKARSLALLEELIFALRSVALYQFAFAQEAASFASVPRGATRSLVHEFKLRDRKIHLREGIEVDVFHDGGGFVACAHVVPLYAVGASREAAEEALADLFAATWDTACDGGDDELSLDAIATRYRLLDLIEPTESA